MITFLTSPKPFTGIAKTNQINAIQSWLRIAQEVEVILYCKSEGTGEAAQELGIECVPDIQTNEFGTPLFGAIAAHAAIHGKYDIQCYVNCDILLSNTLINAVQSIRYEKYLMVGQRIDLTEGVSLDVTNPDYLTRLKTLVREGKAVLHPPAGSDYFLFRRGMWDGLPEIVIGRGGYDNALINHCLRRSIPVIDASLDIKVFHQYHNYSHTEGGEAEVFEGIEANKNLSSLATTYRPTLLNADWIIKKGQLRKNYCRGDRLQYFWSSRYIKGARGYIGMIVYLLWRFIRALGLIDYAQPSWEELLEDTPPDHLTDKIS